MTTSSKEDQEISTIKNWAKVAFSNPRSINGKEEIILHHCILEDLDFCFLTDIGNGVRL